MAMPKPSRNSYSSNIITDCINNKIVKKYKEYTNDDLFNDFGMQIALNLVKKNRHNTLYVRTNNVRKNVHNNGH